MTGLQRCDPCAHLCLLFFCNILLWVGLHRIKGIFIYQVLYYEVLKQKYVTQYHKQLLKPYLESNLFFWVILSNNLPLFSSLSIVAFDIFSVFFFEWSSQKQFTGFLQFFVLLSNNGHVPNVCKWGRNPKHYLICVCVCVCVSYWSNGVRDNSGYFTHISKKKFTTAAIGPFISWSPSP